MQPREEGHDEEMNDRLVSRLWLAVRVSSRIMKPSRKELELRPVGKECILSTLSQDVLRSLEESRRGQGPKVRCTCALCTRCSKKSAVFEALDKIQPGGWNPEPFSLSVVKKRAHRSTPGCFAALPSQGETCDDRDDDAVDAASVSQQGSSMVTLKSIVENCDPPARKSSGSSMTSLDTLQERLSRGTTRGGILCMQRMPAWDNSPIPPPSTILTDPSVPALDLPPLVRRGAFAWRSAAGKARALPPPGTPSAAGSSGVSAAWRSVAASVRTALPAPSPMQGRSAGALRPLHMVAGTPELGKLGGRTKSLS